MREKHKRLLRIMWLFLHIVRRRRRTVILLLCASDNYVTVSPDLLLVDHSALLTAIHDLSLINSRENHRFDGPKPT